jgi:hypothetical protein
MNRPILLWARVLALDRRNQWVSSDRRERPGGRSLLHVHPQEARSERKITMGELVRRVGGVSMTRDASAAVQYVDVVTAVEAAAMRSARRVGDLAINDIDYLKMRQKEIEQRNPDAAEMVAAVVNGVNVAIVHRARQYAIELGG